MAAINKQDKGTTVPALDQRARCRHGMPRLLVTRFSPFLARYIEASHFPFSSWGLNPPKILGTAAFSVPIADRIPYRELRIAPHWPETNVQKHRPRPNYPCDGRDRQGGAYEEEPSSSQTHCSSPLPRFRRFARIPALRRSSVSPGHVQLLTAEAKEISVVPL